MDKKVKIYIAIFLSIVGLIMYAEATKKKPVNWFPSYVAKHKMPYGTYVLKEQLSSLFPKTTIKDVRVNPFLYLADTTRNGTYFFVNGYINFDKAAFKKILSFVARGNDVFVATNGCNIDTLGLKTTQLSTSYLKEYFNNQLLNPAFNEQKVVFDRAATHLVFSKIDTLKTMALGKLNVTNKDKTEFSEGINFIKHPHGKGNFYFHTAPLLFTNYTILKNDHYKYVQNVLSYVDEQKPILWDAYYKNGKSKNTAPLQFVLTHKSLKWAYYMLLFSVLIFVIFKSKRLQRYIPIIVPLKNQTIAFTRTIANMYFEKSAHKEIAIHKITYFLAFIRTKLQMPTHKISNSFYNQLASKSGNTVAQVTSLFELIEEIKNANSIRKEQLIELNQKMESFIENTSRL